MITLTDAVSLVVEAFEDMMGGETYVRKIPSMGILDVAQAVAPDSETQIVGIRPGEKLHEQMIGPEESDYTFDFGSYFKILPVVNTWDRAATLGEGGEPVPQGFSYSSNTNTQWMSVNELQEWIVNEGYAS